MRTAIQTLIFALLTASLAPAFATDQSDIDTCLSKWKGHPFTGKSKDFRTLSTSVRVMGIGKAVRDSGKTDSPELVLVKPSVSVMSKTELHLENSNGWYCLSSNVNVMSKSVIHLACKANLASAAEGVAVLGQDEEESGVTVLGKTQVIKESCKR